MAWTWHQRREFAFYNAQLVIQKLLEEEMEAVFKHGKPHEKLTQNRILKESKRYTDKLAMKKALKEKANA